VTSTALLVRPHSHRERLTKTPPFGTPHTLHDATRIVNVGLNSDSKKATKPKPHTPLLSPPEPRRAVASSPKRGAAERLGLHAWHPYYAGFSESFVAEVLSELSVPKEGIVLDPMAGSGTTVVVAQKTGYLGLGVEINPALAAITRAKDATLASLDRFEDLAHTVVDQAQSTTLDERLETEMQGWIPHRKYTELKQLHFAIKHKEFAPLHPIAPQLATLIPPAHHNDTGSPKTLLEAALLITARQASAALKTKNPTWLKPDGRTNDDGDDIFKRFLAVSAALRDDLRRTFPTPPDRRLSFVHNGDAKALPLPDNSVDAIITSPPYLTRIDYAIGTAPELITLGFNTADSLRTIRRSIMGSTCVTGSAHDVAQTWGATCLETIDCVRKHNSKSSANYYAKTHIQYFSDAESLLKECLRVIKTDHSAAFVVQDSWYKDLHVPLGVIYCEMARCLGVTSARILRSETVRSHLGLVNTRARQYTKGTLQEHVVLLRK
jgi:hypothetical protein